MKQLPTKISMADSSSTSPPWSRKQMFSERMSTARAARHQRLQEDADVTPEATDLDESLTLPRVEIPSDDRSTDDETFVPEEFYKEWIGFQNKYTIKIYGTNFNGHV